MLVGVATTGPREDFLLVIPVEKIGSIMSTAIKSEKWSQSSNKRYQSGGPASHWSIAAHDCIGSYRRWMQNMHRTCHYYTVWLYFPSLS